MATSVPPRLNTSASFPRFAFAKSPLGGSMRSTRSASSSRDRESQFDEPSFCGSSSSSFEIDWCDSDDDGAELATSSEPKIRRTSDGDRLKTQTTADAQAKSLSQLQLQLQPTVCDALSFVMRKLTKCLDTQKEQNERLRKTDLIVPPTLLEDVAKHVIKHAADEPAGLRGCHLTVSLKLQSAHDHDAPISLGSFKLSPKIISTFELRLVLREQTRNASAADWCKARLFDLGLFSKRPVPLCSSFQLEKIDLYI